MNSFADPSERESRRLARRMGRILRGPVGKFVLLLGAAGLLLGVALAVTPALAAVFSDVYSDTAANPDYPAAVSALSDLGVIGGFPDNTFRPHELVTRQQFAKMIVKLLGFPVTGNEVCRFLDVAKAAADSSDPFYPDKYVAVCAAYSITTGKTAALFDPYNNITRAQVITMIVRGAKTAEVFLEDPSPAYYAGTIPNSTFRDFSDPVHGLNVRIAEMNDLLHGLWPDEGGNWDVYKKATRGEVAQILWRLWLKMGSPGTTTTLSGTTTTLSGTTTTLPTTTTTTASTTTTTTVPATLLYRDDFSDPTSGWYNGQLSGGRTSAKYEYGAYALEITNASSWLMCSKSMNVADFRIQADLTLVRGGACGLVLRQKDSKNFYVFKLDGAYGYAFVRYKDGSPLLLAGWTSAAAVQPLGQTNHVEIIASGNSFKVSVNGAPLCTSIDTTVASGGIGLWLESGSGSARALFDNLEVWSK